jgi:predicted tellurium resistance membrane protein TerC
MRLIGDSTWAPENTNGLGIAIAKLPANMTLIFGALAMAVLARRLNKVIWSNVGGQFVLWFLGSALLVNGYQGIEFAVVTSLISALLFFAALTWAVKSNFLANG